MSPPRVSIIIPAFNAEKHLRRAVQSVLRQTFSHWELIIVDDGSIDGTRAIAEVLTTDDARIRVVHQSNQGLSAARNRGIAESSGELIQFLDADDELLPTKLSIQVDILEHEPTCDISLCDAEIIRPDCSIPSPYAIPKVDHALNLWVRNFIVVNAPLVRRDTILKAGVFKNEAVLGYEVYGCEDWEFWLRIFNQGARCHILSDILVRNYQDGTTMSEDAVKMALSELWALHSAFATLKNCSDGIETAYRESIRYRGWRMLGRFQPDEIHQVYQRLLDDPILSFDSASTSYISLLSRLDGYLLRLPARARSKFHYLKLIHAIRTIAKG